MVPDSPAAEAGLLSDTMLPPGEAHRNVGQCGVCPAVGAARWGAGGAGTQCFPLQEGLNLRTLVVKCNIGDKKLFTLKHLWLGMHQLDPLDHYQGLTL